MVADTVIVKTKSEKDSQGWKLTWLRGNTRFGLEPTDLRQRGTEARLYLSKGPPQGDFRYMSSERELHRYVARTFALLPIPIRVGKNPQPANQHQAWISKDLGQGAERLLLSSQALELIREHTAPSVPVSAVYASYTPHGGRVFLGIPRNEFAPLNEHNITVFCKGVRVEKRPRKFLPENLSFLVGLVDFPELQMRLDREGYLEKDGEFVEIQDHVAQCGLRFLELLAEKDPQLLTEALRTHCKMLVAHAGKEPRLLDLLRRHFPFDTSGGRGYRWEKLLLAAREDPRSPYGPKVLYAYSDVTVTPDDINRVNKQGIEVILAPPDVRSLLEDLGREHGIRIANIREELPQEAPVSQPFHSLRARLTPFLNEKGIYDIEFFKAPDDATTPAHFRIEQTHSRKEMSQMPGDKEERVMVSATALRLNVCHPILMRLAERVESLQDRMMQRAADLLFSVAALKSPFDEVRRRVTGQIVEGLVGGMLRDITEDTYGQAESEVGKCFMALPFREHFENVWHAANDILSQPPYEWEMIRADEHVQPVGLLNNVMKHITTSQRFIADVSGENHNVLLELGMMLQKHKQATLILTDCNTAEELPIDLRGEVCAVYDPALRRDRKAMRQWFERELHRHPFFAAMAGKT